MARRFESDPSTPTIAVSRSYSDAKPRAKPSSHSARAVGAPPPRPGEAIAKTILSSPLSDGDKEDLAFEFAAGLSRWNGDQRAEKVIDNPDLTDLLAALRDSDERSTHGHTTALGRARAVRAAVNQAVLAIDDFAPRDPSHASHDPALWETVNTARDAALASVETPSRRL